MYTPTRRRRPPIWLRALLRHGPALRAFLRARIPRHLRAFIEADDILQDAVVAVLERLTESPLPAVRDWRPWLTRIALRKLVDLERSESSLRRDGRRTIHEANALEGVTAHTEPPDAALRRLEFGLALHAALARLTPDQRYVFDAIAGAGLSHREVAADVGKTVSAVKSLHARAVGSLRDQLQHKSDMLTAGLVRAEPPDKRPRKS